MQQGSSQGNGRNGNSNISGVSAQPAQGNVNRQQQNQRQQNGKSLNEIIVNEQHRELLRFQADKKIENYSFSLHAVLGKGSSGTVYLGRCESNGQPVAIKVIDLRTLRNDYAWRLVAQEIDTMKRLSHPHIVKLLSVYQTPNNTYIIAEYCNGGDLRDVVRQRGRLSEAEALLIVRQILHGYAELLRHGMIHRDIKPANILIHDGMMKITDFGFSKKVEDMSEHLMTSLVGTPLYMSPQILKRQRYTARCDVWSVGLILYELICGETPWPAQNLIELVNKVHAKPLQFATGINISSSTRELLSQCLQLEENERLSMEQLLAHPLMGITNSIGEAATVSDRRERSATMPPSKNTSNTLQNKQESAPALQPPLFYTNNKMSTPPVPQLRYQQQKQYSESFNEAEISSVGNVSTNSVQQQMHSNSRNAEDSTVEAEQLLQHHHKIAQTQQASKPRYDSLHEGATTGGNASSGTPLVAEEQYSATSQQQQQQQQLQQQKQPSLLTINPQHSSSCSQLLSHATTLATPERLSLEQSTSDEYQRRLLNNYLRSEYLVNENIIQEQLHFVEFLRQIRNLIEIHTRYCLEVSQFLYDKLTFFVIKHAYLHLLWIKSRLLDRTENILNLSEWQTFKLSETYFRACSAVITSFYEVSQMLESFMNKIQLLPQYQIFTDSVFAKLFSIDAFTIEALQQPANAAKFPKPFFDALLFYVRSFIKEADHRLNLKFKRRLISSDPTLQNQQNLLINNPILNKDEQLAVETLSTFLDYHQVLLDLSQQPTIAEYYAYFDYKRSFLDRKKFILDYSQYQKLRQQIHELDLVSQAVKI